MANDRKDRNRTTTDPSGSVGAYSIGTEGEPPRKRPGWLIPLLVALGLLLLLALLFGLLNNNKDDKNKGAAKASNSPATTGNGSGDNSTPGTGNGATPGTGGGTGTGVDGQLLAAGASVLPLASANADLSQYAGQDATANGVLVQSVPADEGFWVGSSETDRVWVQLTGAAGESGYTVKQGDHVDFTDGKVVASGAGFATKVGVTAAEGAAQLTAQKQHIEVLKGNVKLTP